MNSKLEALWNSYIFRKQSIKPEYQKEIEEMERFIDEVLSSCDKDVASRFVPWLYDYVLLKQKIAFESAYTLANKDNN